MAVSLLNTVSMSEFTDLTEHIWSLGPKMVSSNARQLFMVDDLANHTGNTKRYDEIDVETFAELKRESEDAAVTSVSIGYNVTMTMRRFAKEVNITWEMRRLNKYPEVVAQLTALAHFCPQRQELDLSHRLTFATATSFTDLDGVSITTTVGDGLALVSAVHTLTDSTTTYSNVITGNPVFSAAALFVAEERGNTQVFSNLGEPREMDYNVIFHTDDPTTKHGVRQLLASESDVDQNNPGVVNTQMGRYRAVQLRWLDSNANGGRDTTKNKYWGLAAVNQGPAQSWQAYMGVWEAPNLKSPAPGNNGEDPHNDNWTYGTRAAYGIAVVSGRGLLLSTGAGS